MSSMPRGPLRKDLVCQHHNLLHFYTTAMMENIIIALRSAFNRWCYSRSDYKQI